MGKDDIVRLIALGRPPQHIMAELGISRDQYYAAIRVLESEGVLSQVGDLPDGADAEVCPPQEAVDVFGEVFVESGWTDKVVSTIWVMCERYGWTEPRPPGERYTRSRWTGQAVRRVDFDWEDFTFVVCGFLVPRVDKRRWNHGAPKFRVIHVETNAFSFPLLCRLSRGDAVSVDYVLSLLPAALHGSTTPELLRSLTLAVAWVNESRAVLGMKGQ